MSLKEQRLGQTFMSNEGCIFYIVDYINSNNVVIEFQDAFKARIHTKYCHCEDGQVKNPYFHHVYGVGCLGLMSDGSKPIATKNGKQTREYKLWTNMLQRCYDTKLHELRPTYEEAVVCERWLVFANFLEDIPTIHNYEYWRDNPRQKIALDKDILGNGSKVYCLETTCSVSLSENSRESAIRTGLGR